MDAEQVAPIFLIVCIAIVGVFFSITGTAADHRCRKPFAVHSIAAHS